MRANESTIEFLTEYYAAMEAKDTARYSAYFADHMTATFANAPTLEGADAFVATLSGLLEQIESLHHDVVAAWEEDDDVLIFESVATWTLLDGRSVTIPACSVCRVVDGKFTDQRIYVDNAPLSAALEQAETVNA
ncbi:nuclear transport factor 2 family protein [Arthrobacter bambusae]|uniref:nuclear transport factor 2 family protein n=1 Tax=Arthrobacter bambusae TaxID=1338426 RepID=UPI00278AE7DA|nr:nuclear transport factor 2 family protein [Arthrobacter bambusae]MDQ0029060.1 ketosteroid isomerase-like protein [Arthrobacter bambusae]MDQ0098538.1 ketosteroid isomerase-like protein [Arthrobacter bambusae]